MVHFNPIPENEFSRYWRRLVSSGKDHMQEAGLMDPGTSFQEAEEELRKFVTNGSKTPGHYFMHIVNGTEVVGSLWLELRERKSTEAYLWDISIEEDHRGMGLGKESMYEIERFAKNKGATRISLNVYRNNTVARNLHSVVGFRESAITMVKPL